MCIVWERYPVVFFRHEMSELFTPTHFTDLSMQSLTNLADRYMYSKIVYC